VAWENFFSPPQIAARAVSKQRNLSVQALYFPQTHCAGLLQPEVSARFAVGSSWNLATKCLQSGKLQLGLWAFGREWPLLAWRARRLSGQSFQLAFSEVGTVC
jgi:hypothetical protein